MIIGPTAKVGGHGLPKEPQDVASLKHMAPLGNEGKGEAEVWAPGRF